MSNAPALPRLVLLVDVPGWAYDNIADHITPGLEAEFSVSRLYVKDHPDLATLIGALIYIEPPAILHVFWRPLLFDLLDRTILKRAERQLGLSEGEALKRLGRLTITTSVYDHLGLDADGSARQARVLSALDGYSVASPILETIYRELPAMPAPDALLADGVDTCAYAPLRVERLTETGRPFVVGWVGNSQWGFLEGMPDAKGLNTIIKPAMALLAAEGFAVELKLVDRAEKWRPRAEVAAFYHDLDCLLCASLVEGTPNPVLEAMASGVPVISTDVGIVRMCAGESQQGWIVARNPRAFADAIRRLCETPGARAIMGAENRSSIKAHDWQERRMAWRTFFADALRRGRKRSDVIRHQELDAASHALRPTLKMRVRSFLRRSPAIYAIAAKTLHFATRIIAFARIKASRRLDP